jgi:hypothetical protein
MEKDLAWYVITMAFRSTNPLEDLLHLLKEHCAAPEYEEYGKAIARAIHGVQRELIERVVAEHPELEKEMEAKVAKYGRVF